MIRMKILTFVIWALMAAIVLAMELGNGSAAQDPSIPQHSGLAYAGAVNCNGAKFSLAVVRDNSEQKYIEDVLRFIA